MTAPMPLIAFHYANCFGWAGRPVELVNHRLMELGKRELIHKQRSGFTGIVQLLEASPYDAFFCDSQNQRMMSVADHYYIRCGRSLVNQTSLRLPVQRLVGRNPR
ncbi:hypothetical protein B9Z55_009003 [Caenorhabditis nigoni]|uniref:Uncharacterized protein n=1 Tax=Caenorhabditis nigoni TaxID=1611254 RepID=A0A2G5UQ13_9PELO|nr:hypothetical protein B9Z55_009003 [Caenorhabditis nigoni]